MRNKCVTNHVLLRNETYYFLKRVPYDLKDYYSVKRLCFSLKTKSYVSALRITKSVLQRLEDYWLGIRLQKMDIPAIHLVKANDGINDSSPVISDAFKERRKKSLVISLICSGLFIPSIGTL